MTSPVRSVAVRLSMDPSSYIAGAAKAERSTLALDKAVSNVGPHAGSSMEKAAAGAGKAEGAFGKAQKSAGALGLTLGGLAGAGAAVAVGLSVKWAGDYQSALTKLATTAGESQKNLKMVGQGMLDMAGQVGLGADELAKGMYTIDSAGIHGADSLIVLKAAAQGARQEQADLGHVVDAVTTSLHDYHLPASDAAKVTSQLIAAVSNGKTTFDELTGAMHSVEPIAASAGMSIAQTAGALAAMTASGMHADQAAQNLASSIRSFEKPTGTMRDELYQLGLDAQDLSAHLGQRGIAGTLQMVSEAIVRKMGPAGQVALDSLNKNKAAAQDLVVMMKSMTPEVAKLSSGLLDGSVSVSEYSKAAKGLGGQNAAMALQFLGLYKSSAGFSQILKTGGPAVQTYIGALGKAVGTSEGLSVALQLTGENAAGTNKAIGAVAKAAGDAKGNIQGWDEVQGNFNQRLAEAEAGAKSLAIEAGQHLLPALTNALGYVHDNGPAALHALGTGFETAAAAAKPLIEVGGGAVKVFQALPGPIQETVLALVALRGASAMGWMSGLSTGAGKVRGAFSSMGSEIGAAFTAAKANQVRLVQESGALWGQAASQAEKFATTNTSMWTSTAKAVEEVGVSSGRSVGNLAGLGAAAKAAAGQGLGMMKSAGSGLVSLFGGPWGLAIAGASLGLAGLTAMVEHHNAQIKADTDSVTAWQKQIAFGGLGAADAARHLDDLRAKIAANKAAIDAYNAAAAGGSARGGIGTLLSQQKELTGELNNGTAAWKNQLANMTPVEEGTQRVAQAQHDLGMALKSGNVDNIRVAYNALAVAQKYLAGETGKENTAQMTQNQLLEKAAADALASSDAAVGLHLSQLNLSDSITQLNNGMKDGTLKGNALTEAQLQLAQEAKGVAEQAGRAAAAIATQNGATDTGTTSNLAMLASLKETAKHLSGPALAAVNGYIKDLERTTSAAVFSSDKVSKLGATVIGLPDSHFILINAPTAKQEADLHHLGYVTATLPNGKVVVTADVNPAESQIRDMLTWARVQSIVLRASLPQVPGVQRMGTYSAGGWTGPGAKYTPAGIVHADEFVVPKERVNALGGPASVGALVGMPGYANGGPVIRTSIDPGSIAGIRGQIAAGSKAYTASLAGPGGAPTNVSGNAAIMQRVAGQHGWGSGAQWNALYALEMREAGFRNTAQNPTSTAYGMPQFLDSTWATVGVSKTSDPLFQSVGMMRYLAQRFGDPFAAYRHEQQFGWYHNGGTVQGTPGADVPAILQAGETVRTTGQEAVLQKVLRSRERAGVSAGGSHAGGAPQVTVNARVFVGDREITDIARVEAEAVVVEYATAQAHRGRYNP